ncbi:MAG TPA: hypothetical protein DCE80_16020, partial [Ignavibacteriales bacterium]|nr:hypothetical protein [Ignavibacteriales bacterium]
MQETIKEEIKIKLMIDIAYAELDTNNFESASEFAHTIICHPSASSENRGNGYNLLGLIAFYQKNDLSLALINFEKCLAEYKMANSLQLIAAIEGNIGNIYNMRGDYEKVEKYWNRSLEISSSLGNFFHQGQILLNFGIYYFNKQSFENSIKNYKRAAIIFNTLGDKLGYGRSEINLGEVYLFTCEYQNAIDVLDSAKEIFFKIQNSLEEVETLFLLAKAHYKIGDSSKFNKIIEEVESLAKSTDTSERVKLHLDFLKYIKRFELNQEIDVGDLNRLVREYLSQEERINYFE